MHLNIRMIDKTDK